MWRRNPTAPLLKGWKSIKDVVLVESIFKPKRVRLLFINTTLMIGVAAKSLASSMDL